MVTESTPTPPPVQTRQMTLGWWNLYFLIKLGLYYQGTIDFHLLENLCFLCLLLIPLEKSAFRIIRGIVAVPIALWLLHFDSYLPPLSRLTSQLDQLLTFEIGYIFELLLRFIPTNALLPLAVLIVGYYFLSRIFRITSIVLVLILITGISKLPPESAPRTGITDAPQNTARVSRDNAGPESLTDQLDQFFAAETARHVELPSELGSRQQFDILLLSICSLSWDDMQVADLADHPFFQDFDLVFEQFNSATSYSGPALLRLTRANCGQPAHNALYQQVDSRCLLFEQLKARGYDEALVMNHDGKFDNMLERTRRFGGVDVDLVSQGGLEPRQKAFAGSPVFGDLAMLQRWWSQRLDNSKPVIALYNSATLHDGNRLIDNPGLKGLTSYKTRARELLDDLQAFKQTLRDSGRPVVMVLIPEHGAGLRGDKMQIAGMREIPSPAITHVPMAVKLLGKEVQRTGNTARVATPTSHLALTQVLRNIVVADIYGGKGQFSAASLAANIPDTRMVSQNEGSTVMASKGDYFIRLDGGEWTQYPTQNQ
ncbi:cellulose biosynthesis protein BcsG [Spongiibacter taiwanensis]|uniref:cellulose biosynthesis protein BcsG n=1 Tax=Spongiibacter taiwanensis TaxID=1748242 RepID=UPI002034EE1B|nr:cellulose biosynthesis protein BcsG [Spongiibacter taiwanensis]USA42925.1 cellulose biosynthesis protein BcsG [Spongiibacter taiwanensis]